MCQELKDENIFELLPHVEHKDTGSLIRKALKAPIINCIETFDTSQFLCETRWTGCHAHVGKQNRITTRSLYRLSYQRCLLSFTLSVDFARGLDVSHLRSYC